MSKEAVVFVLDVGPSMWKTKVCDEVTVLDKAITCLSLMISQKILDARKTDQVAIVLTNTDETDNNLGAASADEYQHITVAAPFDSAKYELLRYLHEGLLLGGQELPDDQKLADPIDSIVVAADLIITLTKGKAFGAKRIIFLSDFRGAAPNPAGLNEILDQLKGNGISLDMILVTAEEADVEEAKTESLTLIESALLEPLDGSIFSIDEALGMLTEFATKRSRQVATFKGTLDLGVPIPDAGEAVQSDPSKGLQIPIRIYSKTAVGKLPSAKKLTSGGSEIERSLEYRRIPPQSQEGGGSEDEAPLRVEKDDLVKAYRYGKTLIPFHRIDEEQMSYKAEKGLSLLAFVPASSLPHHLFMSTVYAVVAEPGNGAAVKGLGAFIQGLWEKDSAALARYVRAKGGQPKIVALIPKIKSSYRSLLMITLPFAEDLRRYTFPSFSKLPASLQATETQIDVMSNWIASMDLDSTEYPKSTEIHNPSGQRLVQCIMARVQDPNAPLPSFDSHILRHLRTPEVLQESSKSSLEALRQQFALKKVAKWKHAEIVRFWGKTEEPAAIEAPIEEAVAEKDINLDDHRIPKISSIRADNVLADYEAMVSNRHHDLVVPAMKQLMALIPSFAKDSLDLALQSFQTLRQTALKEDEPDLFNAYLQELKRLRQTSPEAFPTPLWDRLASEKCSLISRQENPGSLVSSDHAADFFAN